MDRRSFFLTSLLPIVAAKRGLLGPQTPLRELWKDRILIMKARGLGWSRLIAQQQFALQMGVSTPRTRYRMTGINIYNGYKG